MQVSNRGERFLRFGLIGYPLGHSLSPVIHTAALHAAGLAGEYRLYPVPPLPKGAGLLDGLLTRLRRGDLKGLNVTIPHKQSVLAHADRLTPAARLIGAANTLYLQDEHLVGENTDWAGFWADLRPLFENSPGDHKQTGRPLALVLGAGGSARAVVYALARVGWKVHVAARRSEQADALAKSLAAALGDHVPGIERQSVSITSGRLEADELRRLPHPALIVNTTPLGMSPETHASPWPAGLPLPAGSIVYDLVYNPSETAFVRAARQAGLEAANGLGMLVEQAALAFEIWTGRGAQREAMLRAAQEELHENLR